MRSKVFFSFIGNKPFQYQNLFSMFHTYTPPYSVPVRSDQGLPGVMRSYTPGEYLAVHPSRYSYPRMAHAKYSPGEYLPEERDDWEDMEIPMKQPCDKMTCVRKCTFSSPYYDPRCEAMCHMKAKKHSKGPMPEMKISAKKTTSPTAMMLPPPSLPTATDAAEPMPKMSMGAKKTTSAKVVMLPPPLPAAAIDEEEETDEVIEAPAMDLAMLPALPIAAESQDEGYWGGCGMGSCRPWFYRQRPCGWSRRGCRGGWC